MRPLSIVCCDTELEAWPDGTLWYPELKILAVADLHLEKGSSFAAKAGRFLPPYDTRETLRNLAAACARHRPEIVVCLGDSAHDRDAAERIDSDDVAMVRKLVGASRWIWIAGNHDPAPPGAWGGEVSERFRIGPITFQHQALFGPAAGEVSGHYHPVAALTARGRGLRRRCFVTDRQRIILPSFGAYTGGLNALDPAIAQLFPDDYEVLLLGRTTPYRLSCRQIRADWTLADTIITSRARAQIL